MRKRLVAVAAVLAAATSAGAGSWTCDRQGENITGQGYIVASRCNGSGTYTATGDTMGGGGTNDQLCASLNRQVRQVLLSSATDGIGKTYVAAWDQATAHVQLATASATPGPSAAFVEVAAGTVLTRLTFYALAVCK